MGKSSPWLPTARKSGLDVSFDGQSFAPVSFVYPGEGRNSVAFAGECFRAIVSELGELRQQLELSPFALILDGIPPAKDDAIAWFAKEADLAMRLFPRTDRAILLSNGRLVEWDWTGELLRNQEFELPFCGMVIPSHTVGVLADGTICAFVWDDRPGKNESSRWKPMAACVDRDASEWKIVAAKLPRSLEYGNEPVITTADAVVHRDASGHKLALPLAGVTSDFDGRLVELDRHANARTLTVTLPSAEVLRERDLIYALV